MKDINEIVEFLEKQLKKIGIIVVDSSIYKGVDYCGENSKIGIIAGYVSGKACVIRVNLNNRKSGSYYNFSITGQLTESEFNKTADRERELLRKGVIKESRGDRTFFSDVTRYPVGHESYGGDFYINHQPGYFEKDENLSNVPDERQIYEGINFIEDFLKKHKDDLENGFTRDIHLWFVPEYSEEYKELEKKYGRHSSKCSDFFTEKVKAKFPKGFFVERVKK